MNVNEMIEILVHSYRAPDSWHPDNFVKELSAIILSEY